MADVELVPGTGQDWNGRARMAAARLHAHGPESLDELDAVALRRNGIDPTHRPEVTAEGPFRPIADVIADVGGDGLPDDPEFHDGNPEDFVDVQTIEPMAAFPSPLDRLADIAAGIEATARAAREARREAAQPGHLAAGVLRRDEAIDRVDTHADDDWRTRARDAIRLLAETLPTLTGDDLWRVVEKPAEPRASGAVFRWAASQGLIEPTADFVPTTQATSHASPSRVWRSKAYMGTLAP
jgi:hypothetical protein